MRIKKTLLLLGGIILLGLLLRVGTARNMHLNPDELAFAVTAINIISTGKISTFHQSPVYFYLTDIGYQLFGVNAITSRLVGIIFGTLTIIVVYLLAKEILKEERAALIAAFFFAVSAYAIVNNTEMDGITIFFIMASVLFYLKWLSSNDKYFLLSAVFLGLAVLNKPLALLLVPIYCGYYVIHYKMVPLPLQRIKIIGLSAGIIVVMLLPIFAYNYLLYTEKNTVDIFFSLYAPGTDNQHYEGLGIDQPWTGERLWEVTRKRLFDFITLDPLLFPLALIGLALLGRKKEKITWFFMFFIALYVLFLWGKAGGGSKNHQVLFFPLFAVLGAYSLVRVSEWIRNIPQKKVIAGVLGATFILTAVFLSDELTQKAALIQLQEAAHQAIEPSSVVMTDPRIYTGNQAWALHDTAYFDAALTAQVAESLEQNQKEKQTIRTYYIECVTKDCGWGRGIKEDQNIQKVAESVITPFRENGMIVADITDGKDHYRIYQTDLLLNPLIFRTAEEVEWFYGYPVGWKGEHQGNAFDEYDQTTFLHTFGKVVLYLDLLLVFGSVLLFFYFLRKEHAVNKEIPVTNHETE